MNNETRIRLDVMRRADQIDAALAKVGRGELTRLKFAGVVTRATTLPGWWDEPTRTEYQTLLDEKVKAALAAAVRIGVTR